jgi:CelD/BcsL family acetyltransferase involved in cellulose biosynthesis
MQAAARSLTSLGLSTSDERNASDFKRGSLTANLELSLVTDRADFDALEDEWNALFDRAGKPIHVFQSFNFCWHWANHYLQQQSSKTGASLSIVTGRRNGRLIMVWPLVSERAHGVTQTFWMGEPASQYGDALVDAVADAADVLAAGFKFLRQEIASDVLRLRRVRGDANVARLLPEIGAQIADQQIAPYMDLSTAKNFGSFEERFSSKSRRNRRRLARRLEEKGPLEFVRLHGGKKAGELAAQAIAVKSEWLKDRGLLSNALNDPRTPYLFSDLATGADKPVPCVVSVLKTDGETASYEISFICKGRLVVHVMAFALEYEKAGVGVLLLEQNLKKGYDEGLAIYDMMAPGDPYKLDWCDQSEPVTDWTVPVSAKGHFYARIYLGFLRGRLKSALKSVPQPVRRLLSKSYSAAPTES